MLQPDVAKKELEKWAVEDGEQRQLAAVDGLPKSQKKLRPIALAVLERDTEGREFDWQDWEKCAADRREQARALDRLAAADRLRVFRLFFGDLAAAVESTWQFLQAAPYQSGSPRKAFRAPHTPEASLDRRFGWLESMAGIAREVQPEILTPAWLAAWVPYIGDPWQGHPDTVAPLLSAVIDEGGRAGDEVFNILCQSARREHEIGAMGRHVIRGLLGAARPDGWELIENMLRAAQRQEGLRQSILESVDEAHPEAFRRMLRLVRDEKLARFSSVTRAVDVWFGLRWDSASVKVINDTVELALAMLDNAKARKAALRGDDPQRLFMALWATAFEDAAQAVPLAATRLADESVEVRFVAAMHLAQLGLPEASAARVRALADDDLRVALCALQGITGPEEEEDELPGSRELFEALEGLFARMPAKPTSLKPLVWPWTRQPARRDHVAAQMVGALGTLPPTRLIPYLKAFDPWQRRQAIGLLSEQKKWDALTRETLFELAGDASADVREAAFEALAGQALKPDEAARLEGYLARKSSDLRREALALLLTQPDADALASADRLIGSKKQEQRLAGLELLRGLAEADRERAACMERAAAYTDGRRGGKKLSKDEQTQVAAVLESDREVVTLENALGLMDPAERTPPVPPQRRKVRCVTPATVKLLESLDALVHEHRETPIRFKRWGRQEHEELLGNVEYGFPSPVYADPIGPQLENLPLRELWEAWSADRPKSTRDADGLELLRADVWLEMTGEYDWDEFHEWLTARPERAEIAQLVRGEFKQPLKLKYREIVDDLVNWLLVMHPPRGVVDFVLDVNEALAAMVPQGDMAAIRFDPRKDDRSNRRHRDDDDDQPGDWREAKPFEEWDSRIESVLNIHAVEPTPEQCVRRWRLAHWKDEPFRGAIRRRPDFALVLDAYRRQAATLADVTDHLLGPMHRANYGPDFEALAELTAPRLAKETKQVFAEFPEIAVLVDHCRDRVLEVELARGEAETPATVAALSLGSVPGAERLIRILAALGKEGFKKGPTWTTDTGRRTTLTELAGVTYPAEGETPESFAERTKAAVGDGKFPEERLLELAFLAPQWTRFIERHFRWDGFAEGLYWFMAHMRYVWGMEDQLTFGTEYEQPEGADGSDDPDEEEDGIEKLSPWEKLIQERTPLSATDRMAGAIDVAWFHKTNAQLGAKRWGALAAAAKFAATPAQAKRAQFVTDVLLGQADRDALIAGIRGKKLKENVRLLGLLPLAKGARAEKDIAERYGILQEYLRYARGLSAMTRDEAVRSGEVGLQNLALTAGYADPLRLQWALEAESTKDLAKGPVTVSRDDVSLTLSLDERAKPVMTIRRGDKELKSLPKALKQDPKFVELSERGKELRRQSARVRQSLEEAMCRGDEFTGAELIQLGGHALLAPLMERLVLIGEGIIGYADKRGKALRDYAGHLEPVKKREKFRIAHPVDLLQTGEWDRWQRECFHAERVQPFKQVFRELYVPTKQERADRTASHRYAGQQVHPRQAYALWGQRGWKAGDGVWKTFHDLGLTASVTFNYGVTTPLEVEGLTIESIVFHRRDGWEPLPLVDVPPRVFSEVMRDVDLVVSVAHRGEVDPEASASTVEMRAGLVRETCLLLAMDNVRLQKSHALVRGELGEYTVHLGSGVVHRQPGGAVCLVPVHAQHRGRLFLPFADDDPRTAEVVSKVLLLARDTEIDDPTILDQLRAMA